MSKSPKVFLSHASEDKDRFVEGFARLLRSRGVDAWLDKWEIMPGDSLVAKLFDEGISNANAVIVVLSQYSIIKPWVNKELNSSVVRQVSDGTRLIPVVIDDCEVPASLRDTLWIKIRDIDNYEEEFKQIVNTIFGHSEKPPLGSPPKYVNHDFLISGLEKIDSLVLKAICEDAIEQDSNIVMTENIVKKLSEMEISRESVMDSLEILVNDNYLNSNSVRLRHMKITLFGMHEYMRACREDYDSVTLEIASLIVNEDAASAAVLKSKVQVEPFIVDHILDIFASNGYLTLAKTLGGHTRILTVNAKLKRFILN